jgi:hypothetical protein
MITIILSFFVSPLPIVFIMFPWQKGYSKWLTQTETCTLLEICNSVTCITLQSKNLKRLRQSVKKLVTQILIDCKISVSASICSIVYKIGLCILMGI